MTRIQAFAQSESISASFTPARASAAASASSRVFAAPPSASGLRNGTCEGGPVHHAAQNHRPRFVFVIEQTGA